MNKSRKKMSYKIVLNIKANKKEKSVTLELPDNDLFLFAKGVWVLSNTTLVNVDIYHNLVNNLENEITKYLSKHIGISENKIYVTDYGMIDDNTLGVDVSI